MNDILHRLELWYLARCDDDWEHQYGVRIDTLDNPGWTVEIDLLGTPLAKVNFSSVNVERSEHDWVQCSVEDGKFKGAGGPENLGEILRIFLDWAT